MTIVLQCVIIKSDPAIGHHVGCPPRDESSTHLQDTPELRARCVCCQDASVGPQVGQVGVDW